MNPLLARLHPYPFERLRELTRDIRPNPALRPISLGIGEPKHPTPALVHPPGPGGQTCSTGCPATRPRPASEALQEGDGAAWLERRYALVAA